MGAGSAGAGTVELVLEGGHDDVPRSRAFTRRALGGQLSAVADDAALVVTELVTNAVLNGGPPVRLRLREVPDGVRLEVADRGPELPAAVRRSTVAMTGRGLALVDALTRAWGVEQDARGGKVVRAELAEDGADGQEPALTEQDLEQLLARVEPADDGYRLRWANAGHLPPVLRTGEGRLHVLDDQSDLLLGLDAAAERRERTTELPTGSSLVLYTDGLVERRDASLDAGIARVTQAVSRLGDADAEATADAVVTAAGSSNEDDIAVLVLRVGPHAGP